MTDDIREFLHSITLCLHRCHEDRGAAREVTTSLSNVYLGFNDPKENPTSVAQQHPLLREKFFEVCRLILRGELDFFSAFYAIWAFVDSLYSQRENDQVNALILCLCRGLKETFDARFDKCTHPGFLVQFLGALEQEGYLEEALAVCRQAADKEYPDTTKGGYKGRLKRLEKKLETSSKDHKIDWATIETKAIAFFDCNQKVIKKNDLRIEELINETINFCKRSMKMTPGEAIDSFREHKHRMLPEIESSMAQEAANDVRRNGSWRFLYKELFRLEGCFWCHHDHAILAWNRDTEQDMCNWPVYLVRNYKGHDHIENKFFSNNEPFNAQEVYYLANRKLSPWGERYIKAKIIERLQSKLIEHLAATGKCFVRQHFDHPSYRRVGRLRKAVAKSLYSRFHVLLEMGLFESDSWQLNQPIRVEAHFHVGANMIYIFPARKAVGYCVLPQISKQILSYDLGKLVRQAENEQRLEMSLPKVGQGWVSEAQLLACITNSFPDDVVVAQGSPPWLGQQRFDVYLPEWRIALEFQGEQHFRPLDIFGGAVGFAHTQERDARKRRKCAENDCVLIEVLPDYDDLALVDKILHEMKRRKAMRGLNTTHGSKLSG